MIFNVNDIEIIPHYAFFDSTNSVIPISRSSTKHWHFDETFHIISILFYVLPLTCLFPAFLHLVKSLVLISFLRFNTSCHYLKCTFEYTTMLRYDTQHDTLTFFASSYSTRMVMQNNLKFYIDA